MAHLKTVKDLDLTPPDNYADLQTWLARNFEIIQQRMLAPEIALSAYDAEPARSSVTNLHGGLHSIVTGGVLNSGTPLVVNNGVGKLFLMPKTLVDGVGTVTITGTKVDRSTGVETPGFSETVTVDWTTAAIDTSTVDAQGNPVYALVGGFMTTEWYRGTVTFTTTDVSFSNIDAYSIGFEQLNDSPLNELDTFDINFFVASVSARFDAYLYSVIVGVDGRATITMEIDLHLGIPPFSNRYYRLRNSTTNIVLDGSSDGIFCQLYYASSPSWIEDATVKLWLNNPSG